MFHEHLNRPWRFISDSMSRTFLNRELSLLEVADHLLAVGRSYDAGLVLECIHRFDPNSNIAEKLDEVRQLQKNDPNIKKHNVFRVYYAKDDQIKLRVLDILTDLCDFSTLSHVLNTQLTIADSDKFLALAKLAAIEAPGTWSAWVNQMLASQGVPPVQLDLKALEQHKNFFLALRLSKPAPLSGPLVTVCMTAYNASAFIERSIQSILCQSHQNFELIVIDDCSTDSTAEIVQGIAQSDSRVSLIKNDVNVGTYVCRNIALNLANGEFFTVQDADDFSLPNRLSNQAAHMVSNPECVAIMTEWLRMNAQGAFSFKLSWGGNYRHESAPSLMIRTKIVKQSLGYWDSVRFAADTEYIFRIKKKFGEQALFLLKTPSIIGYVHDRNLTNHPLTGLSGSRSFIRKEYRANWTEWQISASNLFLPFPLYKRKFEAAPEMLPNSNEIELQVQRTMASWVKQQLAPWLGRSLKTIEVCKRFEALNEKHLDLFVYEVKDGKVNMLRKNALNSPLKPGSLELSFASRAVLYQHFFQDVVHKKAPGLNCVFVMSMHDQSPYNFEDVPQLAYQKVLGSNQILVPDVDFLSNGFYQKDVTDMVGYSEKQNTAVFVGSTTGANHTVESVKSLRAERLRLAAYFKNVEGVSFTLPIVVQTKDEAAKLAIESLNVAGPVVSWTDQLKCRFLICVDGNGASCSRVYRALRSNSVPLKFESKHVLHYFNELAPYKEYLPVYDPSQVIDFLRTEQAQPGYFESIARNGQQFADRYLTREALTTYTGMLLTAYASVFS